jgi:soluble lytic murein transglycosylase-like protein
MKRLLFLFVAAVAALPGSHAAQAQQRALYETLVATHARANAVPEVLVHRVIVRESKYQPNLVGRGGTIGLMQIKLATARGLGYSGDAAGLRDPDTNLHYGVLYLAGAYRAANGDHDRAVHYYASGYYEAAKRQRLAHGRHPEPALASAPPKDVTEAEAVAKVEPVESATAEEVAAASKQSAVPQTTAMKPKRAQRKKLANAREPVPRPPASIPTSQTAQRVR